MREQAPWTACQWWSGCSFGLPCPLQGSAARAVKMSGPAAVGPVIAPVAVFRVKPAGSAPTVIEYV
jgi:hypothetical protein